MPDDKASPSDTPQRDESSASAGTPVAVHGEPPTLPPFSAGTGPRPLTLAGMPAVDVFGGADDLFANVPVLGPRTPTGPVPTLPVASAASSKVPVPSAPSLGPSKAAPSPKLSASGKPLGPPPQPPRKPTESPKEPESTSTPAESTASKPVGKPGGKIPPTKEELAEAIKLSPDLEFELSVGLVDAAEVIRTARERAAKAAEAKPVADAKPVVEPKPATASKPAAESTLPPTPKPAAESTLPPTAKPAAAAKPIAESKPVPPAPKAAPKPLFEPKPAPKPVDPKAAPAPAAKPGDPTTKPGGKPSTRGWTLFMEAEAVPESATGAEPQAIVDDRRSPPPPPTSPKTTDVAVSPITASAPESSAKIEEEIRKTPSTESSVESAIPRTIESSVSPQTSAPEPPSTKSPVPAPVEPLRESSESSELSRGDRDTSPSVAASTPSKPEQALAPPAPRSAVDDRPRVGVPYEPPAVVVRLPVPEPETPAAAESESAEPEEPSARGPITLPKPGRAPAAPPRAPVPPADAGKVVPLPVFARPDGAPDAIGKEDTAALVAGMADEMVEQARRARVHTQVMEVPPEIEPANGPNPRRKLIIGFLLFAVAASLVVALLPSDDEPDDEVVASNEAPEPEPTAEPEPPQPDPVVEADTTEPAPTEPGPTEPPPTEPEPTVEPEPAPVAKDPGTSKTKSTKPKTEKPTETKPTVASDPEPKPEPKPANTSSQTAPDNRDAKQLYDAAKAAYDKGKASEAYKLALASYKKGAKPKTAELMVLAACKLGDKAKASSALDKVSGLRKAALRKQCKSMGTSI